MFLAEKQFEGCDGLLITDEIRVVIAAQACLLLLHRDTDYYPDLKSILVYGVRNPAEFFAVATECFFEKARPLRQKHPELYDELKRFYQQDPAEWRLQSPSTPSEAGR